MPITKDHVTAMGVALSVGLGVMSFARTMGSAPAAPVAAPIPMAAQMPASSPPPPPPPSKCADACKDIAKWCVAGSAVNCVDLLTRYEREGTVTCDDGISASELASLNWCPNGGEQKTLVVKQ